MIMKKLLVIAGMILGGSLNTFAQDVKTTEKRIPVGEKDENGAFILVDYMPEFPGGEEAMMKFLGDNTKYPAQARENGSSGVVIVSFIVEVDGSLSNIKVLRSVEESLDNEAIRVVKSMPKWNPGKHNGEKVRVNYNLPLRFSLDNKPKKKK